MNRSESHDAYLRVRDYLFNAVKERAFGPGERMPTERQLAEQLGVSRATTRRALGELEAEGLIQRHVGRGTFVRPNGVSLPSGQGIPEGVISPAEYIEARLRFEPELAWLIATQGTASDLERMEECLQRSEHAATLDEFELFDAAFHQAIVAATHNQLAIRIYDMIHTVRHEQAIWCALRQRVQMGDQRAVYQREHREILGALRRRDAAGAHDLMAEHIRATRRRLLDY